MTTKQINTRQNKVLIAFLAIVFIITVSTPVKAAPTELHPEGNTVKQTTFQIQANCDSGQALTYTSDKGLICKDEKKGSGDTTQSEISKEAEEFLDIINRGDEAAKLAFEVDFCGESKYLIGFTIEGEIRCLDKTFPQLINNSCEEGEVSYGFEKTTGNDQLDQYEAKCINLEDYIVSTPSSQKETQLLQNISSAISCEEGEIITRLPLENVLLFVGAPSDDDGHTDSGAVYIFKRDLDENWAQENKISENNGTGGNITIDLDANDSFGESVSHYNKTIAIGAPGDDDGSTTSTTDYSGAVYLFEQKENGDWEKQLKISDNSGGDGFLNVDLSVGDYFGSLCVIV